MIIADVFQLGLSLGSEYWALARLGIVQTFTSNFYYEIWQKVHRVKMIFLQEISPIFQFLNIVASVGDFA